MEKLLNKIILDHVDNLITFIKKSNDYKEYLFLSEKLSNHKKIQEYISRIKNLQKEIVKKELHNEDITTLEEEINKLLDKLNRIPLYVEFINKQTELDEIYQNIKTRLDEYFYKILN